MTLARIEYRVVIHRYVPDSIVFGSQQWREACGCAIKERVRKYGLLEKVAPYRTNAYMEEGYCSLSARPIDEYTEEH